MKIWRMLLALRLFSIFAAAKIVKMLYAKREIRAEDKEYNELRDRIVSLSKTIFEAARGEAKAN